ncbi:hypothetical protein [Escherichia phage UB]|uniref:Homing endonuclease n=1 Tax=Escherichia phage UB TaxID=2268588 RepID=A0A2Z5HAQ3_9CAUD|nr:hypothetical protein [Escherichia phage UB]
MASGIKLTQKEAEEKVYKICNDKNYKCEEFVYINTNTRLILKCPNPEHERWNCSFKKFIYKGTGCPECNGRNILKEQTARDRVIQKCKEKKYTCKEYIFNGSINTILELNCDIIDHPSWKCSYNHFINTNTNCPSCSKTGYDINKPGFLYINEIYDTIGNLVSYKFGITGNCKNRFRKYNANKYRSVPYICYFSNDGNLINELEKIIKKEIKCKFLNKSVFKCGYTETIDVKDIDRLLTIIDNDKYRLTRMDIYGNI